MGYPKIFERPVRGDPAQAYAVARRWVADIRAKVVEERAPQMVKATWGKSFRLATQPTAKKIFTIECFPIQGGTLVRMTMDLSALYVDDGHMLEAEVTRSWVQFADGMWVRFGFPPTSV